MKNNLYATPKNEPVSNFQLGKEYQIQKFLDDKNHSVTGRYFQLIDDNGEKRQCLERKCAHLDGGSWTIFEKKSK